MGLFDFLKPKNQPADAPAPTPPPAAGAPAADAPSGPRYKGANYTLPTPAAAPVPPPPLPAPPQPAFEPVNQLEEALLRAATEPAARPLFYQGLLQEEVLVVLHPQENLAKGEITPTEGMEIQLQVLTDGKIPVFTALERIREGAVELADLSYLRLRGFDLFQMVQGTDCALNPFSAVGKLLPAQELADLLAGHLTGADAGQQVQVTLGEPTDYPTALADALRAYCATNPAIERAYLAQMQLQNSPEPPRLLLAFQAVDNDPAFLQEVGPVVQPHVEGQQTLDMLLIDPTSPEPINQYFLQTEPFYQK